MDKERSVRHRVGCEDEDATRNKCAEKVVV